MDKKFVTVGAFKELLISGGISEVIAQKNINDKYNLFGLSLDKSKAYLVKEARGSNQQKEWKGLGYLGGFIESTGMDRFTVAGLIKKEYQIKHK